MMTLVLTAFLVRPPVAVPLPEPDDGGRQTVKDHSRDYHEAAEEARTAGKPLVVFYARTDRPVPGCVVLRLPATAPEFKKEGRPAGVYVSFWRAGVLVGSLMPGAGDDREVFAFLVRERVPGNWPAPGPEAPRPKAEGRSDTPDTTAPGAAGRSTSGAVWWPAGTPTPAGTVVRSGGTSLPCRT